MDTLIISIAVAFWVCVIASALTSRTHDSLSVFLFGMFFILGAIDMALIYFFYSGIKMFSDGYVSIAGALLWILIIISFFMGLIGISVARDKKND